MFPETVEPIGEDQKQLYHELALNIQTLARQQAQPIHDLIRQSATIFKQRTEFEQHQQLLHMLSTYAPEPCPALVHDDWMTTMRGNDKIMPSMDMGAANMLLDTALEIARREERYEIQRRKERYAMFMWSTFSDRALRRLRRSERIDVYLEQRKIAIRMRVQQTVQHAQQRRLTLAAEASCDFSQCEIVSSGNHTRDILAIKIAIDDDVAVEWAIQNSRMLRNSAENLGQEENHIPHHGNKIREKNRVDIANDVGSMLIDIAAQNADTTTVNLWIDALKVSLGSEHTNAVFKCMQEAYLAGTKDAYARLRAKIWLARSSRNTAQYQLASRSNACSTLLDILENDINCQAAYSRHLLQKETISVANEVQSNNDRIHVDAIAYYYATINPRKQDNMARDRHLPSSADVREDNYDNKHHIHISERVTRVTISVYLDIV